MNDAPLDATGPPLSTRILALVGVVVACAYLANIGAGVIGEIPDFIPGLGNLDEVFFSGLLIVCLAKLGINIVPNLQGARPAPPKNIEGPK